MKKLEKIIAEIESLKSEEFAQLSKWFSERDWEKWDREIERDSKKGKLDFLVKKAIEEKDKGTLKDL